MASTILYLRHDEDEHFALQQACRDAKMLWDETVTAWQRNPCVENNNEIVRAQEQWERLVRLLARYEGSLKAVGK